MKKYSLTTIKLILSIFIVLVGVFFINTIQAYAADVPPGFWDANRASDEDKQLGKIPRFACSWGTTAKIRCSGTDGRPGYAYQADYYFDIASTAKAGHLVFRADAKLNDHGYLHLIDSITSGRITNSPTDGTGGYYVTPITDSEKFTTDPLYWSQSEEAANWGTDVILGDNPPVCAVNRLVVGCINGFDKNLATKTYVTNKTLIDKALEVVTAFIDSINFLTTCNNKAPLGFILCPALEGVNKAIGTLIGGTDQSTGRHGLLIDFLKVPSINISDPDQAIVRVVQNVVNIANIIYILIFLILIFSSSLPIGLDNYTIKKTLPKFIAAVILTQFSLVICSVVVDFFNLLGLAIPNLIFALTQEPAAAGKDAYYQTADGVGRSMGPIADVGATILGYVLLFIFAILALIAALTAMIYLVIRYFVIYIMIILAPLAYVAWVLPGTEKFFSQWWKNFIRVNAMFLMIMGMLSISIVLAQVFADTDDGNGVYGLIGALMPIIALLMVPKTLKWTTSAMNSLVSGAAGFATGKLSAGGKYAQGKAGQGAKAAKEAAQNKIAESKFGNTRFGGVAAGAGAGSLINSKGAQNRLNAKQAKLRSERSAGVAVQYANMRAGKPAKPAKTGNDVIDAQNATTYAAASKTHAENIVNSVGSDKSSRFALMAQAAQSQDVETIKALQGKMNDKDWDEGVQANYKAFDGMPLNRARTAAGRADIAKNLSKSDLVEMSAPAQAQLHAEHPDAVPLKSFADASDDRNTRSKISQDLLIEAHARASATPADPTSAKLLGQLNSDGSWK